MRVILVSQMFPRSEKTLSGVFVLEQAKSLRSQDIAVEVVSPRPRRMLSDPSTWFYGSGRTMPRDQVDGVPVSYMSYLHVPLRLSTRFEAWSLQGRLFDLIRREHERARIDVVHAHQLFPAGYAAAVVGSRLGIPVVCTAHGSDVHTHPHRNRGIARYTRAALRLSDRVVAVSADLARRISDLEPRTAPVDVIYNGVDPHQFAPAVDRAELRRRLGLPVTGVGISTVSRLVDTKGIPELVRSFRRVLKANGDAWLVIVGGGPLESRVRSWEHELGGRLVATGPVAHAQVPEYLKSADVFALPSHMEGVPVALLEAMACGLPVVATAVGGIPEVVTDGLTGFLVQPRDEEQLTDSLQRLVEDPDLRRSMGEASQELVRSSFHWEHGSAKLARLYADLVARQRSLECDGSPAEFGGG